MHLSATYGIYGNKPAVLEISKPALCDRLDSPTIVLKQRIRRIIRQSIRLAEE
jgi:hypothetical protein